MEFCIQKELGEKSTWIMMEPDTLTSWREPRFYDKQVKKWDLLQQDAVKLCFENLAKLLRVGYFPPFSLCAPACFCSTAFEDGLKTERKEGRGKGKHISDKDVFFLLGKW